MGSEVRARGWGSRRGQGQCLAQGSGARVRGQGQRSGLSGLRVRSKVQRSGQGSTWGQRLGSGSRAVPKARSGVRVRSGVRGQAHQGRALSRPGWRKGQRKGLRRGGPVPPPVATPTAALATVQPYSPPSAKYAGTRCAWGGRRHPMSGTGPCPIGGPPHPGALECWRGSEVPGGGSGGSLGVIGGSQGVLRG